MSFVQPDQASHHEQSGTHSLVNLNEIAEIELFILRRMKEFTVGDHASVFHGAGFNFVGTRDWQPGRSAVLGGLGRSRRSPTSARW
jgi:hypothetical protein